MKIKELKEYLIKQSNIPTSDADKQKWLTLHDAKRFLVASTNGMVPIYISCNGFFAYGVIVPEDRLHGDYVKDLLGWNFTVSGGYSYGTSYEKGKTESCFFDPMDWTGTEILNGSMPVFFLRSFEGHSPASFLEVNQKISHVLGMFWLDDRKAFCRINELGDYENIATMDRDEGLIFCTLRKEDLDFYLFLSRSVLIRVFDVSRSLDWMKYLGSKNRKEKVFRNIQKEIFAKRTIVFDEKGVASTSKLRGFQIIRNKISQEEMMKKLNGARERNYASFIIWDWKNDRICEWSSDSKKQGNYFVKSDLPFQTSPAFFRPEVLAKYKQDPAKYKIDPREIKCRSAWSITYDINEEGQVHAYIGDLAYLPYEEQLYWKSFNEKPKAGLSKRAIKTDFRGEWDLSYDPLLSLKEILGKIPPIKMKDSQFFVWKMPKSPRTRDINFLNYVVTESTKEWEDQILALAQILVDGLCSSSINKLAEYLGCHDKSLGSIKQFVRCLEKMGVKDDEVNIFAKSLTELWELRSTVVAHPGKTHPKENLKNHYANLLESCDKAMRKLAAFIEQGILDI